MAQDAALMSCFLRPMLISQNPIQLAAISNYKLAQLTFVPPDMESLRRMALVKNTLAAVYRDTPPEWLNSMKRWSFFTPESMYDMTQKNLEDMLSRYVEIIETFRMEETDDDSSGDDDMIMWDEEDRNQALTPTNDSIFRQPNACLSSSESVPTTGRASIVSKSDLSSLHQRLSWTSDTGVSPSLILANEITNLFDMDFSVDIKLNTAPRLPELSFRRRSQRKSADSLMRLIPTFETFDLNNHVRTVKQVPTRSSSLRYRSELMIAPQANKKSEESISTLARPNGVRDICQEDLEQAEGDRDAKINRCSVGREIQHRDLVQPEVVEVQGAQYKHRPGAADDQDIKPTAAVPVHDYPDPPKQQTHETDRNGDELDLAAVVTQTPGIADASAQDWVVPKIAKTGVCEAGWDCSPEHVIPKANDVQLGSRELVWKLTHQVVTGQVQHHEREVPQYMRRKSINNPGMVCQRLQLREIPEPERKFRLVCLVCADREKFKSSQIREIQGVGSDIKLQVKRRQVCAVRIDPIQIFGSQIQSHSRNVAHKRRRWALQQLAATYQQRLEVAEVVDPARYCREVAEGEIEFRQRICVDLHNCRIRNICTTHGQVSETEVLKRFGKLGAKCLVYIVVQRQAFQGGQVRQGGTIQGTMSAKWGIVIQYACDAVV
ncbi:hypothetical protein DFQ28_009955 [Apophysomyces sp. BC1034]|nr:hypothetical protein DFQ28_009955 [Apophysomyces sp. BC1034]